jgi:hypothetical protein
MPSPRDVLRKSRELQIYFSLLLPRGEEKRVANLFFSLAIVEQKETLINFKLLFFLLGPSLFATQSFAISFLRATILSEKSFFCFG